jgi:hypothetical protein
MTRRLALSVLGTSLLLTFACDRKAPEGAAPQSPPEGTTGEAGLEAPKAKARVVDPTVPVEVAAPVEALLTDGDPGLVAKVRLGAWTELAPVLGTLGEMSETPEFARVLGALGAKGPVDGIGSVASLGGKFEPPDLAAVDTSRPLWLALRLRGSAQTWGLFRLGVSLVTLFEPISGWEITALVPTKDPAALTGALAPYGLQTSEVGGHLRVSYLSELATLRGPEAARATPTPPVALRQTPALRRFVTTDAPAALYVRAQDVRALAAIDGVSSSLRAARYATPENRQKLLAMGASRSMIAFLHAPRAAAEFEDHALVLGGDDAASAAFVDAVSTRTVFGRNVHMAAGRLASLPALSDELLPPDQALVDLDYAYDLEAVGATYEPFFAATRGARAPMTGAQVREIVSRLRDGGPYGYLAMFAGSPLMLPALLASRAPDSPLGDARPVAARLRIMPAPEGDPVGKAAMAIAFRGDPARVEALIPTLRAANPPAVANALAFEVTPAPGGGVLTARLTVGADVFGDPAPVTPKAVYARASLDGLASANDAVASAAGLGRLTLSSADDMAASFMRLSVSRDELAPLKTSRSSFTPLAAPDPCVDAVSLRLVESFGELAMKGLDERDAIFASVQRAADACAEEVDSPLWDLVPTRLDLWLDGFGAPGEATGAAALACEAGDQAGCNAKAYFEMIGGGAK